MARKRMIDPNLWTDEGFLELSMPAKMLFIGMISHADDEGRGPAKPNSLKARIFPADDIAPDQIPKLILEIKANTRTVIYHADGVAYYQLSKWHEYQSINRPTPSKFPSYNDIGCTPGGLPESSDITPGGLPESSDITPGGLPEDSVPKELKERREVSNTSSMEPEPEKAPNVPAEQVTDVSWHDLDGWDLPVPRGDAPVAAVADAPAGAGGSFDRPHKAQPVPARAHGKHSAPDPDLPLFKAIEAAFLSKNGGRFTDWGKEGASIKAIIAKAKARCPEDPTAFSQQMLEAFWRLKSSPDKFWPKQPFIPSCLNASGVWDRVLESMRDNGPDPEFLAWQQRMRAESTKGAS